MGLSRIVPDPWIENGGGHRVERAVGVDARVDQFDELPDPLASTWASDGVYAPVLELAESVPAPHAVLVDRTQLSPSGEPCLLFDPCAVSSWEVRRADAF